MASPSARLLRLAFRWILAFRMSPGPGSPMRTAKDAASTEGTLPYSRPLPATEQVMAAWVKRSRKTTDSCRAKVARASKHVCLCRLLCLPFEGASCRAKVAEAFRLAAECRLLAPRALAVHGSDE